ncbi:ATP-binding protein [Nocardioides litoris]|uniref:ATP-binding protein n=1 Tax=Nocardioides litoris TaxID=1926648 RepID=UPI00111F624E|nr:ATP-binding protein [Nocardioides litoris]
MTASDQEAAQASRPGCVVVVPFGVTAPSEARAAVDTDLHARGCDDEQRKVVLTVLTELVMNALLHGAGGEAAPEELDLEPEDADEVSGVLRVAWSLEEDLTVTVAVTDYGTEGAPHLEEPGEGDAGGRGLRLVEALTTSWGAERRNGATTVTATVPPQA